MGQEVEIKQLTVKAVKDLQKSLDASKDDVSGLATLSSIFKSTVIGAETMKDKDFEQFPIQALTELSNEILVYNGLGAKDDKGGELGKKN
ncbi:hypothetical protein Aegir_gp24 [Pelagibacter phage Aegir EXVC013S]|nr:hypothetical protein Aegir_gp24 [Pelagibacter phage Aegir EXVC013S]QLF88453.1 hypothetical protein Kolga_gp7 [Pelagibacter phage Kolga EXVC016S]